MPFHEVLSKGFSETGLFGVVVEGVVHQLKGDPNLQAEEAQSLLQFGRRIAQDGPRATGGRDEPRRLA